MDADSDEEAEDPSVYYSMEMSDDHEEGVENPSVYYGMEMSKIDCEEEGAEISVRYSLLNFISIAYWLQKHDVYNGNSSQIPRIDEGNDEKLDKCVSYSLCFIFFVNCL